ncbi:hypothetical protein HPB49_008717 [Dermacentor silvarum]|uniref:Uncharacterized protein n=1 Tax=Dermacentor silvarum TaxID=543639 RepID=A0ACB8C2Q2_DERSI|nr:hypothetical protein HPB49_008717 [Dermacentor silvarum]
MGLLLYELQDSLCCDENKPNSGALPNSFSLGDAKLELEGYNIRTLVLFTFNRGRTCDGSLRARCFGGRCWQRILLPILPSGESMQQCVFLHGDLAKRPYRLEDFLGPLEEAGFIKNITSLGAFQMNHIWLERAKADKDAMVKTGGLQVKGGFCAVIDPIQQDITMKVHWVDFAVQNESVRQALSNFGDVLEVPNDNWSVAGFEHATSTTRVVRMRLKQGVELDDLPHLLKFGTGTFLLVAPGAAGKDTYEGTARRHAVECAGSLDMKAKIVQEVTLARVTKTVIPTDDVQENIMDAEEAEKSAPNSNTRKHESKDKETDAKKAGGTMPDSQDLTKATEERAQTGCTQEAPLFSEASEEEDMSDCTETTTEEEKADATAASAVCGKRLRTGIPKLTEDSTERKVKRLERQWQRVAGAKGKKYVLEVRSASSSPVRGQRRDK